MLSFTGAGLVGSPESQAQQHIQKVLAKDGMRRRMTAAGQPVG